MATKEVNLTIRVEPQLRADFVRAAQTEHRPAAQVLREFMREYVEQRSQRSDVRGAGLSAAERREREDAVRYARASVGLEGFAISAQMEAHTRRFLAGEIDLAEFVAAPGGELAKRGDQDR